MEWDDDWGEWGKWQYQLAHVMNRSDGAKRDAMRGAYPPLGQGCSLVALPVGCVALEMRKGLSALSSRKGKGHVCARLERRGRSAAMEMSTEAATHVNAGSAPRQRVATPEGCA